VSDTTLSPQQTGPHAPAEAPPKRPRRSFREWVGDRNMVELSLWIGLLVVAVVLRVVDLGDRPFHHDESQDAYFSYTFFKDFSSYEYNPLLHGPLRFYLTALNYLVFGDSNFTARLAPATMGVLAVGLPYLLRHQLGRVAAFAAAVMLAVGPTFLYFSRFAREDIYLAAITLALIVAVFRFLRRPHAVTLCLAAALVACSYATKESGIVLVAIGGLYFVVAIVVQGLVARRRGGSWRDGEVLRAVVAVRWVGWVYALATFVIVYTLLFTQFLSNFECMTTATEQHPARETSCVNALYYGLEYWRDQQHVARGGDSAWLYVSIIIGEEWPVLLLALVGTVFAFLRPTTLRLFLVWFFIGVFGFHAWGSERFAWLALHPLLPLILLAGVGVQCLWELRSRTARIAALIAVGIGAVYMVVASYRANSELRADPRSLLVSTQSSEQVRQVAEQVEALDRASRDETGAKLSITVDSSEGATFPYAWYFRHKQIGYIDATSDGYVPDTQALVLNETAYTKLKPNLAAYDCRRFDFRVWWVKDYGRAIPGAGPKGGKSFSLGSWWDYLTERKAWDPTGGMKEWFCVRRDVGPLPGKGTGSEIPPPAPVS
jgi:uncharacterized protein (TIGR03663 family)